MKTLEDIKIARVNKVESIKPAIRGIFEAAICRLETQESVYISLSKYAQYKNFKGADGNTLHSYVKELQESFLKEGFRISETVWNEKYWVQNNTEQGEHWEFWVKLA